MSSLIKLSISDALRALKNKEFTVSELVNSHIEQAQKNKYLNFYITETFDKAIKMSKIADQNYNLNKVPIEINFCQYLDMKPYKFVYEMR